MNTEQSLVKAINADIKLHQIFIDKYCVNYAVAGSGSPMLLIHGANFGWGVWYPNISELAKKFTLYMIDLPGAGRSTRLHYKTLDPEKDLCAIVDKFIQILDLRDLVVVGFSIGGWLALRMALIHPNRVRALVVENSVGFADYMKWNEKIIGFYPLAYLISTTILRPTRSNKNIERFLRGIFYDKQIKLRQEFIEYFYETMSTSHNLLFISWLTAQTNKFLLGEKLKSIPQPVLIIWGKEDHVMPLSRNQGNFLLLPHYKLYIIEKVGHIPSLENPEVFNKIMLNFLLYR